MCRRCPLFHTQVRIEIVIAIDVVGGIAELLFLFLGKEAAAALRREIREDDDAGIHREILAFVLRGTGESLAEHHGRAGAIR